MRHTFGLYLAGFALLSFVCITRRMGEPEELRLSVKTLRRIHEGIRIYWTEASPRCEGYTLPTKGRS